MHDKNYNGSIDLDECVQLLYARFGKVRRVLASRPVPFAPHPATTHHVPSASRLSPPASRLPPPASRPLLVQLSLEDGELGEHPREDIVWRQDGQARMEGAFLLTEPV